MTHNTTTLLLQNSINHSRLFAIILERLALDYCEKADFWDRQIESLRDEIYQIRVNTFGSGKIETPLYETEILELTITKFKEWANWNDTQAEKLRAEAYNMRLYALNSELGKDSVKRQGE